MMVVEVGLRITKECMEGDVEGRKLSVRVEREKRLGVFNRYVRWALETAGWVRGCRREPSSFGLDSFLVGYFASTLQ
jgi:hypothetical protein